MPKSAGQLYDTQVMTGPSLEKCSRRAFSSEYKATVLAEAIDDQYGELGQLLHREKLSISKLRRGGNELGAECVGGWQSHSRVTSRVKPLKGGESSGWRMTMRNWSGGRKSPPIVDAPLLEPRGDA